MTCRKLLIEADPVLKTCSTYTHVPGMLYLKVSLKELLERKLCKGILSWRPERTLTGGTSGSRGLVQRERESVKKATQEKTTEPQRLEKLHVLRSEKGLLLYVCILAYYRDEKVC